MATAHQFTADDVDILARTMWGEARGEGSKGMEAVGNVAINRFFIAQSHSTWRPQFGSSFRSVMTRDDGSQFNCWYHKDPNYTLALNVTSLDPTFEKARAIAYKLLTGQLADNTNGADSYYATGASPDWRHKGRAAAHIGHHHFRNLTGVDPEPLRAFASSIDMGSKPITGLEKAPVPMPRLMREGDIYVPPPLPRPRPDDAPQIPAAPVVEVAKEQPVSSAQAFAENKLEITFKSGDTVSEIALAHGVAKEDVAAYAKEFEELNHVKSASHVKAGHTYIMPSFDDKALKAALNPADPIELPEKYVVQKGDTLTSIANKFFKGDDREDYLKGLELAKENGIKPNILKIGQTLDLNGPH